MHMETIKIKRFIRVGEFGEDARTSDDILASGGSFLDHVCSDYEPTVFEGEDGKVYVASVEVVIEKADPEYVADLEAEDAE